MFEIALTLASSVREKVNEAIAKLYQAHTHVLIEFEEELQNDK